MYILVENLKKQYESRKIFLALRGIDLQINEGEFVGIMGPSGSGKTTLLNMISTIDAPTEGRIRIDNLEITKLTENEMAKFRGLYLGFIFQDFNLVNNMTVRENILLPQMIKGKIDWNALEILANKFNLSSLLDKYPFELSGGEKQRVSAARAVIHTPKLLLADEPTGNLDSKSTSDFLKLLKEINQSKKVTTIIVTHDPYVASYTDRVFILKDGKIFSEINGSGNRQELHNKLINSLNILGGE